MGGIREPRARHAQKMKEMERYFLLIIRYIVMLVSFVNTISYESIYIYIYKERETERERELYLYMYKHTYT